MLTLAVMRICVDLSDPCPDDSVAFPISGLVLEGAGWSEATGALSFSRDHRQALTHCQLCWTRRPVGTAEGSEEDPVESSQSGVQVAVPVYLHGGRSELIVTVYLPAPDEVPPMVWRQRGVAIVAWSPPV